MITDDYKTKKEVTFHFNRPLTAANKKQENKIDMKHLKKSSK